VGQAAEQRSVARGEGEGARRAAVQQVAQAWNQLAGARASRAADAEQAGADQVALEGVRAEQGVGRRTVLDILNAQQELENAQLTLVSAQHDEYLAAVAVLAATGRLDAPMLSAS